MSSELQSRTAASRGGRGATRGGRGGFAGRNSTRRSNGETKHEDSLDSLEDEGEIGQLKKLYGDKTPIVKEMFPDWSEVDILFALRETDGDIEHAVTSIAEGHISQWDEVSKPKKTKAKEPAPVTDSAMTRALRNAGAGPDKTRGRPNARPADRGGRSARGRSVPATNGARPEKSTLSIPTEESQAYESAKPVEDAPTETIAAESAPASSAPAAKTWASMLRKVTAPPKAAAKPAAPKTAPEPTESIPPPTTDADPTPADTTTEATPEAPAPAIPETAGTEEAAEKPAPEVVVPALPVVAVPEITLPPPKDELTEQNLEQAAGLPGTSTPISASQQQHQNAAKALGGSGYAASAIKATDRTAVRTPSYSRRILDQEEAVRMPANRDVDLSMKFGALSFTGAADDDVDGEREEPETRTQPPDESPVAHPRASLPPVDAFAAAPKQPAAASALPTPAAAAPAAAPTQPAAQQYGRFGQTGAQDAPFGQKPYEAAYGQQSQPQAAAAQQYDNYQGIPATSQATSQQAPPAFSSAPTEYSQYFTSEQNRAPYNNYYQGYGQAAQGQDAQNQRSYSGYPLNDSLSQYPQSNNSRFGGAAAAAATTGADAQNSGSTTPNPPAAGQQATQQPGAAGQAQHSQQHQANQYQQSYGHPYYASPYYAQYASQYGSFNQGNFGVPYGGKGGYGGNHHPYGGMNPQQNPYEASQGSGFSGSSLRHGGNDNSTLGSSGLSDYNRVGGQSVGQQSSFGGSHDGSFGRGGTASYQSQAGQYGAQQSQVGAQSAATDELKGYGDAKGAAGATPSLVRPGSATNNQSSQSGLPPPQSSAQQAAGYSGYPSHLQQHSGLHGNQSAAGGYNANQYGSYGGHNAHGGHGQGFGGNSYYSNQQQRGWGGNYH